ncbi:hypothetical protein [Peristeroidobacter soli]|uniref:hypothetical protein n=1 Tax=Peristeroidobacter soli TaxID=2497877 RepID=UPI00101C47DF|nr:hypothetical protein [Peristeroidobacter soli]
MCALAELEVRHQLLRGARESEDGALENLPNISAAMERGELSYSKVRELTRVACPATEDYLLTIAIHGTAHHVEQLVRYYRHAKEAEELTREARQKKDRALQYFYDHDGSLIIKARLPAQVGALFMKAIDPGRRRSMGDRARAGGGRNSSWNAEC